MGLLLLAKLKSFSRMMVPAPLGVGSRRFGVEKMPIPARCEPVATGLVLRIWTSKFPDRPSRAGYATQPALKSGLLVFVVSPQEV